MSKSIYYICKMKDAKNGLGIVSENYYKSPESESGKKMKPFTIEIVFQGSFEECLDKKRRLINSMN